MGCSQGCTLSANVTRFADGSSVDTDVKYIDRVPIFVKELIAGGAFAKTAVAPHWNELKYCCRDLPFAEEATEA